MLSDQRINTKGVMEPLGKRGQGGGRRGKDGYCLFVEMLYEEQEEKKKYRYQSANNSNLK